MRDLQLDTTGRVALEHSPLLNEKLGKLANHRFDPLTVMETEAFLL